MAQKRFLVLLALFLGSICALSAQSNDQIDVILAQEEATIGAAAYLALSSAGLIDDSTTFTQALAQAADDGILPEGIAVSDAVSFGQFAYLMMAAHEASGGLMYLLFPGPRYAAREFVYQNWSPESPGSNAVISGQFMIRVAGRFLDSVEASL